MGASYYQRGTAMLERTLSKTQLDCIEFVLYNQVHIKMIKTKTMRALLYRDIFIISQGYLKLTTHGLACYTASLLSQAYDDAFERIDKAYQHGIK